MRILCLLFLLPIAAGSVAQEPCASAAYLQMQKAAGWQEAKGITEVENFLQSRVAIAGRTATPPVIKIPVVVHIIYNKPAQNISDEQVQAQLENLNRDCRRRNADTLYTPERFRGLAADVQVEFYLATADPKGRATNGIVRKSSTTANWLSNDKIKQAAHGGDNAWDSKSYLNIWVGNFAGGNGYSSVPGGDANLDGIVINSAAFNATGRIVTHEVGHWLGLRHIWGDAACGDDLVADTPPQNTYTRGCPTGFRSTCDNGTAGDMYMNYMDYTSDACMNLFTEGQKQRMLATFANGGPREALLQSKGLSQPWTEGDAGSAASAMMLYPNPAATETTVKLSTECIGKTLFVVNANGAVVLAVVVKTVTQKLALSSLTAGVYFIRVEGVTQKLIKL